MAKQSKPKDDTPPSLEQALLELEQLVQRMESGEQSLDAALTDFEAGIRMVRSCRDSLDKAEQQVQILLADSDTPIDLEPSAAERNDDA